MCKTWPEMDTLIPLGGNLISPDQEVLLRKRYDEHAMEYATEEHDLESGLPINGCMSTDTVNDIEEEIVDAVFNCLILLFKIQHTHVAVVKTVGQEFEQPDEIKIKKRHAERLLNFTLLVWDKLETVR